MRWIIVGMCVVGGLLFFLFGNRGGVYTVSPLGTMLEKPLAKYSILRLQKRVPAPSQITLDEAIATTSAYTVYAFHFLTEGKKVTGLAHIPTDASDSNKKPVIVQFRGYVERDAYESGVGTRRSAEVFARNGYISLAPDFLGYGKSDMPSTDAFEERFQTYITALDLLASVSSLDMADATRMGIWGHSNGGQIALTVLESTGKPYPTTLWAPVTKPFPYSILYYTDEAEDRGKALRKKLADFERDYDVEEYSMLNYVEFITSAMQLHQGTADEAVPSKWNESFVQVLRDKKRDIEYFVYPGADHNMLGAWNTVIARDVAFFNKYLRTR